MYRWRLVLATDLSLLVLLLGFITSSLGYVFFYFASSEYRKSFSIFISLLLMRLFFLFPWNVFKLVTWFGNLIFWSSCSLMICSANHMTGWKAFSLDLAVSQEAFWSRFVFEQGLTMSLLNGFNNSGQKNYEVVLGHRILPLELTHLERQSS